MKNMKKLVSLLTALLMVIAMCVPAMAESTTATTYTITVNNSKTGHTYKAYQVFSGDLSDDVLSNVVWGSGISNGTSLLTVLQNLGSDAGVLYDSTNSKSIFADASSAANVAEILGNVSATDKDNAAKAFAKVVAGSTYLATTATKTSTYDDTNSNYKISDLAAGYYLVMEEDGSLNTNNADGTQNIPTNDAYTGYILEVVANTEVTPKSDYPTVEKKVDDKDDSDKSEDGTDWQDSADYDIGDSIPYQLTGTLPSNYADYDSYSYTFTDTLSAGLTYNNDAKVYVVNGTTETEITAGYTADCTADSSNALTSPYTGGSTLTVTFSDLKLATTTATINKDSKIVVRYSATLNTSAVIGSAGNPNEVYLTYSNNPNGSGNGKTTTDKVTVFTFKLVVNKVDGDGNPLAGAKFQLQKYNASSTEEDKYEVYKQNNTEVTATETATKVNNEGKADSTGTNEVTNVFTFKGLDAGKYRIVETTTPAGYNTIEPIVFEVVATHDETANDPALQTLIVKNADGTDISTGNAATFTVSQTKDSISTDVENLAGSTLPETGGIGTTLFYVIGGVLVLAAVVLLVTRKRVDSAR